jgi:hypothetical protein
MIAVRLHRTTIPSSAMASAYSVYHGASNGSPHTITAMGRWSSLNKALPRKLLLRARERDPANPKDSGRQDHSPPRLRL